MKIVANPHSPLYRRSIEIIKEYQASSGAYVASPNFPTYQYSWLRDGAFIAHAMDQVGEFASARAFLRWVHRTLSRQAAKVDSLLARLERGETPPDGDYLHTRFTLAGDEATAEWGNHQPDGYGSWLWALAEHVRLAGDAELLVELAESIALTVRYLSALWRSPSYDCWEEHPQYIHPYTLAAIYGGLAATASLLPARFGWVVTVAEDVRRFTLAHALKDGRLVKSLDPSTLQPALPAVDASLMGAVVPYGLLALDDPIAQATLAAIERDLARAGGVYRYLTDTYYGGGQWVLLAAWLGWCRVATGEVARARELLAWVEAQADSAGHLPEQVSIELLAPDYRAEWQARWGPIARPLLWSHAMYLILCQALVRNEADSGRRQERGVA